MSTLSTLSIENLIFSGIHGSTGREVHDRQRFRVSVHILLDISKASETDNIRDTYDYKDAAEIARYIIEEEHHALIEKIASRIAERVCYHPLVTSADVKIEKLDAHTDGIPAISVSQKRIPQQAFEKLVDFDIHYLLEQLETNGGVSIPIISDSYRTRLLEEAETYHYEKQPEIVGPAKVREQLSSIKEFRPGSLFFRLKDDFQKKLDEKLVKLASYPFAQPLAFNEMSLQLYEKGSIGITPHMDGLSQLNLICIFVLTGTSTFALCDDRSGLNARTLDTTPGNVIIMRAPGFLSSDFRPFHFVKDITERRIVFGLRQSENK